MPKNIPHITADQMREVDRAMIEDYGIQLLQMMENAGRNLARLAMNKFLAKKPSAKRAAVFAGSGGNGGGAIAAARRLHNFGCDVEVFTSKAGTQFTGVPETQLKIVRKLGVRVRKFNRGKFTEDFDLIIDGIIGNSLIGAPSGTAAQMITAANTSAAPVLSLDIPSGIDSTTGEVHEPAIIADATMTLALPKTGFTNETARKFSGKLYLADISVPPELFEKSPPKLNVGNLFTKSEIIRI